MKIRVQIHKFFVQGNAHEKNDRAEMKKKTKNKNEMKEREEAFQSLPPNIKQTLTEEEINAFLHYETWPETLFEKLKDFIVPGNSKK